MIVFKKVIFGIVVVLIGNSVAGKAISAQKSRGTCDDYNLEQWQQTGERLRWSGTQVKVVEHNATVFREQGLRTAIGQQAFNANVRIVKYTPKTVFVENPGTGEKIGWMRRHDLLCGRYPLVDLDQGIERKFIAKTATYSASSPPVTVKAYRSSVESMCASRCLEISRFSVNLIYAERNGHFLLADRYALHSEDSLLGWVKVENGFSWNTAYGLRPKVDVKDPICAYKELEHFNDMSRCHPILGGMRWLKKSFGVRIPILGMTPDQRFYKVALALPGVGVQNDNGKVFIDPMVLKYSPNVSTIDSLRAVDVFFLIDGTKSLSNILSAIVGTSRQKGIVDTLIESVIDGRQSRDVRYRFGFRIYRDAFAGNWGVNEGLALPKSACASNDATDLALNKKNFTERLRKVQATKEQNEDYAENLFGGLDQAIDDISGCPEHFKMLFVIGDHGYDMFKQKQRDAPVFSAQELVGKMAERGLSAVIPLFVQTPYSTKDVEHVKGYSDAYKKFEYDSRAFLTSMSLSERKKRGGKGGGDYSQQFVRLRTLDDQTLKTVVGEVVRTFTQPKVLSRVELELSNGEALATIIENLRQDEKNVPGLFWDTLENGACKELGEQCQQRVFQTTFQGYIEASNQVMEEVWVGQQELRNWRLMLGEIDEVLGASVEDQRAKLVAAMVDSVYRIVKSPHPEQYAEEHDAPIEDYVRRKGAMPTRRNSPLLGYKPRELRDESLVSDCEIERLIGWIRNSREILDIVSNNQVPEYSGTLLTNSVCQSMSEKGRRIPIVTSRIKPLNFRDDFGFLVDLELGRTTYWIPAVYLP